jgi:crotonobetainyl-CoA:carnitine CoA-transferase CaiB-like acyl-CoA transferase
MTAQKPQALEDIVVTEFAAFAAGPCVGKYLANHGAFVVKVESRSRLDGFRTHYPPFKDNKPGVNRSGVFAMNNDGVYSVGINLKAAGGMEVARKLVAKSDVVIENFTPGTMKRLGLGYDDLQVLNSRLVMLSTCNLGQTGPRAEHPGFGSQLTSLSGFTNLIGEPDRNPVIVYGPYIDYIAVGYGYIAVLAALERRQRTGRGQYIDLAQYEGGVHFVAPGILEHQLLGTVPTRQGNRHSYAAPHGVYPCKARNTWCTISVFDDQEWGRLVEAMGGPVWARSPRFATQLGRKENEPDLDSHLSEWTRTTQTEALMTQLQRAGIHSAKVNNIAELFGDPQLAHRGHWGAVEHSEVGAHHVEAPAFALSETPHLQPVAEPLLNEHTEFVLQKLLGFSSNEIAQLADQGAVEVADTSHARR